VRQAKTFIDCPHKDAIQHCPLYVAGHVPNLLTCFTGQMETDYGTHCAVERGEMDYRHAVETVRAINPMLVAQCEFGKMKAEAMAQHNRNMRVNGVH
jgi:hypothetical protein